MDTPRFQRISEIFDTARNLPADEREPYLREACGDDAEMLAEVRSLLKHHEQGSGAESRATP